MEFMFDDTAYQTGRAIKNILDVNNKKKKKIRIQLINSVEQVWCFNSSILLFCLNSQKRWCGKSTIKQQRCQGWQGCKIMSAQQYFQRFSCIWMWKISLSFPFAVIHGCVLKHLEGFAVKMAGLFLLIEYAWGMQRAHED